MSWCEQLTRKKAPSLVWNGPAQVHNLLSSGDEEDKPEVLPSRDEKECPACERVLPATRANFYAHTVRGKSYLHTKCKDCMRAEQAERDSRRSRATKKGQS